MALTVTVHLHPATLYIQLHPTTSPDKVQEPKSPKFPCVTTASGVSQSTSRTSHVLLGVSDSDLTHRVTGITELTELTRSIIISACPWSLTGFLTVLEDEVFFPNWLTWERQSLSHLERTDTEVPYRIARTSTETRHPRLDTASFGFSGLMPCMSFRCVAKCDAGSR